MAESEQEHLSLLVDVSELAARLAGSADIRSYLGQMVGLVADHLHSDVCSIYLYDDVAEELVLEATVGLAPDSVGRVRMKLSEGLTGMALRELRAVREDRASRNPNFKAFEGINEEAYDALLAMPIQRGVEKIGVLVVQRGKDRPFTDADVMALRATASQLAGVIENARMLMGLQKTPVEPAGPATALVKGQVASRGFARGPAVVHDHRRYHQLWTVVPSARAQTIDEFHQAMAATEQQLEGLQTHLAERLPEMASLIFDAHLMMLKDPAFVGEMVQRIDGGENPPKVVLAVGRKYMDMLAASPHAYMREKEQDVEDLVKRLMANLTGVGVEIGADSECVVVARELFPSDILKLASADVRGLVVVSGGVTSHVSILARSLKIPLVIADEPHLLELPEGTDILLDAEVGNIYVNPTEDVIERFRQRDEARTEVAPHVDKARAETYTRDGQRIRLLANINLLTDIDLARHVEAEGVGLYRSEFPFLVRTSPPSEEEQCIIYRKLIDGFDGRQVTFRTLDIGADKLLAYYDDTPETNPAMGLRSIRFSFRHEDLFRQQLRAILRAGAGGVPLRIMFPMISSVDDFHRARATLEECKADLRDDDLVFHDHPDVGIMVEVPSAVEIIDALAEEADFLCIGSNDLIQFLLAVDRGNEKVASYFTPHHPAVLRSLNRIAAAGNARDKEVSICGEMAHEAAYLPFLIGIGVRALSVDPLYLIQVQQQVSELTVSDCAAHAAQLFAENTISGVAALLPEAVEPVV